MGFGAETPVTMFPPSDSGHCDVMGNVWEHCEDHFNPLEGGLVSYVGGEHMCNYEFILYMMILVYRAMMDVMI